MVLVEGLDLLGSEELVDDWFGGDRREGDGVEVEIIGEDGLGGRKCE